MTALQIRPFTGALGAEVKGLDRSRPLAEDDFARVHRAHLDHHVLVFRDQRITPEQQIAFSRRFRPLQIHVLQQFLLAGKPEVLIVSNILDESGRPIGLGDAGHFWHSDLSYKERPSLGSMLHAQELPASGGKKRKCRPWSSRSFAPTPRPAARHCSSASISRRASSASRKARATTCCGNCSRTA